jgi:hypothetical protein
MERSWRKDEEIIPSLIMQNSDIPNEVHITKNISPDMSLKLRLFLT